MKTISLVVGLVAATAFGSAIAGEQLLVTTQKHGASEMAALDFVSSGKATGIEFRMTVPGGAGAKVDLSRCASELPAGFGGACSFAKGQVIGIVYSDSNAVFPAGVMRIGTISVGAAGQAKGAKEGFQVTHVLSADPKAQALPTTSEVVSADNGDRQRGNQTEAK